MKQTVILSVVLFFAGCGQPNPAPVASKIDVGKETLVVHKNPVDLGYVPVGTSAEATFTIENVSRAAIELTTVQKSCSCTSAVMSTKVIEPGARCSLVASIDTSSKNGEFATSLDVNYTVAETHQTGALKGLRIRGIAYDPTRLLVTPAQIDLGDIKAGATVHQVLRVSVPQSDCGISTPLIVQCPPWLKCVTQKVDLQHSCEVHISGTIAQTPGTSIADRILLSSSDGKVHLDGACAITGYVFGDLVAEPRTLMILVDGEKGGKGMIRIKDSRDQPISDVKVINRESSECDVSGRLSLQAGGSAFEYNAFAMTGKAVVKGTLDFSMNVGGRSESVSVPYLCIQKAKKVKP